MLKLDGRDQKSFLDHQMKWDFKTASLNLRKKTKILINYFKLIKNNYF